MLIPNLGQAHILRLQYVELNGSNLRRSQGVVRVVYPTSEQQSLRPSHRSSQDTSQGKSWRAKTRRATFANFIHQKDAALACYVITKCMCLFLYTLFTITLLLQLSMLT